VILQGLLIVRIKSLLYYPIKSCRGVEVDSAHIDPRGLENDRRLMIVDENGNSVTQREMPKLAVVEPFIVDRRYLTLDAPGISRLQIEMLDTGDNVCARVWNQPYEAVDQGDEVAAWLSAYLGHPARLVRIGDAFERVVPFADNKKVAHVSFADHFPVVITTQEGLEHLNSKLEKKVQMSRYRPNVIIEDCQAFDEYTWSHVKIGEVLFEITRVCDRCSVTTIDQETAGQTCESLQVLSTFKVLPEGKPVFGLHASPLNLGSISIKSVVKATVKDTEASIAKT
jgi:uncharacterized protein